jgi:hypothetical protein
VVLLSAWFISTCAAAEPLYVSVHVDRAVQDNWIVVTVFGKVTRSNLSPVNLASVSIEVSDPYGSSVHIALINSGNDGSYSDTFQLESNRSPGNYTIYVTASKLGFQDAQAKLTFSIGLAPFNISISPTSLTVKQGEVATFRVILESKGQISSVVHIEVIDLPTSASYNLSSNNETAPSTITLSIETSDKINPGSYRLIIIGRSTEGESTAYAELVVEEADRSAYYLSVAFLAIVIIIGAILYRRKRTTVVKKPVEPLPSSPEYLEGLALSPSILLSLPDHLRRTAIILCNLKEASANEIAARSGRVRAAESDYLNQLVRMGIIKKKRKGRESYFYVE